VEELELMDDMLVFYEENQDVTFWAIKTDAPADDPAVFRAFNEENLEWDPDSEYLSEFLTAMLFLQAVNGGMAYSGIGDAVPGRISSAAGEWNRTTLRGAWSGEVLVRNGQILFVYGRNGEVFGGGRTREDFVNVQSTFNVTWNNSTLDDEPHEEIEGEELDDEQGHD